VSLQSCYGPGKRRKHRLRCARRPSMCGAPHAQASPSAATPSPAQRFPTTAFATRCAAPPRRVRAQRILAHKASTALCAAARSPARRQARVAAPSRVRVRPHGPVNLSSQPTPPRPAPHRTAPTHFASAHIAAHHRWVSPHPAPPPPPLSYCCGLVLEVTVLVPPPHFAAHPCHQDDCGAGRAGRA
jgi:hypothetical protein